MSAGKGESAYWLIWLFSFCSAGLLPTRGSVSAIPSPEISAARNWRACSRIFLRFSGSLGLATNSAAPRVRACRALAASFWPESTRIFMVGECASRSLISWKPSSGRWGMGGRPRSTSASCGASSSCLSRLTAWWRESLTMTSKSFPSAYERVSVMSGSSSTIKRLGRRSSGMGFDAFQEGALQRRFPVALAQSAGRARVGHRSRVENRDAVADLLDVGERMGGEKEGSPLGLEVQEQVPGAVACLGVQAAHRLVENVQIALRKKAG